MSPSYACRSVARKGGVLRLVKITDVIGITSEFTYNRDFFVHAPSGLNLASYRAYDTELGSWLNRHPIDEQGGPKSYQDVWKGATMIGERGVFSGSLTEAGKQLTPGQQEIVTYFEKSREFNLQPDAYGQLSPMEKHGTVEGEIYDAGHEIVRLRLAADQLEGEIKRRLSK